MGQDAFQQDTADAVEVFLEQWRALRGDVDTSGKAVTGRVLRLAALVQRRFGDVFETFDLTGTTYGVLVALRRAGDPDGLTPSDLSRELMVTSGGMTPVVDRLEQAGRVERVPNPADRRGALVRLTADGRALVDRAMEAHVATELELVEALTTEERSQLAALLRKLLLSVEGPAGDGARVVWRRW